MSRYLTVLVGSLGLVAGSLALTAPPASAANSSGTSRTLDPLSAVYIDANDPHAQLGSGDSDLPVGAWRDDAGKHHMARMLVTFDISAYRGTKIESATIFTRETAANHCPDRSLDVWSTDAVAPATSWANPPTERQFIGNVGATPAGCPAAYLGWIGTGAVASAVAAGHSSLTLEFRVPEAHEGDVAYGRRIVADVRILVHSDAAPNTPTQLRTYGRDCATEAPYPYVPGIGDFQLSAKVTDPDTNGGDQPDLNFVIWPVEHPDQRTELNYVSAISGSTPSVHVPAGYLADGVSYGWTVRADDGILSSDWAAPCYFTADLLAPAPPTVASTDYPADHNTHGGAGIPGTFTFGANGSADVVTYLYGWNPSYPTDSVSPATMGGDVTITLAPPANGPNSLTVISVDRSGLQSGSTRYDIYAAWTAPSVEVVWPLPQSNGPALNPGPGMSGTFTFRPAMTDVVSYEYWVDGGGHHTVAAAADGTGQAVVPAGPVGFHTIHVRSTTGTGVTGGIADLSYIVDDVPFVSSTEYPENEASAGAGIPGTFTFTPKAPGVVGWAYMLNWSDLQTIDAGPDGTGTLQWTPDSEGPMTLSVFAIYADGTYSQQYDYYFNVGPWCC